MVSCPKASMTEANKILNSPTWNLSLYLINSITNGLVKEKAELSNLLKNSSNTSKLPTLLWSYLVDNRSCNIATNFLNELLYPSISRLPKSKSYWVLSQSDCSTEFEMIDFKIPSACFGTFPLVNSISEITLTTLDRYLWLVREFTRQRVKKLECKH
jgi:hypothetical protein